MSGFCGGHELDPCFDKKQYGDCGCICTEDPSIRSLRKRLCRLEGNTVVIISDNFFAITFGTVDKVTCGTVELTGAEVFTIGVGRVIVALSKINLIIPVTDAAAAANLVSTFRASRV